MLGNSEMFTGIIEEVGTIRRREGCDLSVAAKVVLDDVQLGDSIAINGACMTVVRFTRDEFLVQVSPESYARTTLGDLKAGDEVNLERAMALGDRFGGHVVQGHVDAVGRVEHVQQQGDFSLWTFSTPEEVSKYLVPKGSITINGISLTVVDPQKNTFDVAIIPKTLQETTLRSMRPGDSINLEADIFSKHVLHYMTQVGSEGLTMEMLTRHGFANPDRG
jgi:riboflavin synthase